jgi:hypothetical protein
MLRARGACVEGKQYVEWDNPYARCRNEGPDRFSSGYYAMMDCDLLLMLGANFLYLVHSIGPTCDAFASTLW